MKMFEIALGYKKIDISVLEVEEKPKTYITTNGSRINKNIIDKFYRGIVFSLDLESGKKIFIEEYTKLIKSNFENAKERYSNAINLINELKESNYKEVK